MKLQNGGQSRITLTLFTLVSPRWGLRLLRFLGDLLPRLFGDSALRPGERSFVTAGDLLRLRGLELLLDLDLERRDPRGLTGLSFSCLIRTFGSRSEDSRRLCRFSLVILSKI